MRICFKFEFLPNTHTHTTSIWFSYLFFLSLSQCVSFSKLFMHTTIYCSPVNEALLCVIAKIFRTWKPHNLDRPKWIWNFCLNDFSLRSFKVINKFIDFRDANEQLVDGVGSIFSLSFLFYLEFSVILIGIRHNKINLRLMNKSLGNRNKFIRIEVYEAERDGKRKNEIMLLLFQLQRQLHECWYHLV